MNGSWGAGGGAKRVLGLGLELGRAERAGVDGGGMVDGGETRSVLEPATATATGAGPAPIIVPDASVYLDLSGRRTVHGRV